jgi:hypothetical protein
MQMQLISCSVFIADTVIVRDFSSSERFNFTLITCTQHSVIQFYRVIQKVRAKLKERIEGLRENNFRIGIHVLRSYPESVEAIEGREV